VRRGAAEQGHLKGLFTAFQRRPARARHGRILPHGGSARTPTRSGEHRTDAEHLAYVIYTSDPRGCLKG